MLEVLCNSPINRDTDNVSQDTEIELNFSQSDIDSGCFYDVNCHSCFIISNNLLLYTHNASI